MEHILLNLPNLLNSEIGRLPKLESWSSKECEFHWTKDEGEIISHLRLLTHVKVSVKCLFKDDKFSLLVWLSLSLLSLFSYPKAIHLTCASN